MRRFIPLSVVLAIASPACSGDGDANWEPDSIEFGDRQEFDVEDGLFRVAVNPEGDRYAVRRDDTVCIVGLGADESESDVTEVCSDPARGPSIEAGSWSNDGDGFAWTDDFTRLLFEPDVSVLAPGTGDFDVLTDDGVDDVSGDDGTPFIDQAPFFGPDDVVHFFRTTDLDDRPELARIDDEGEVEQVDGVRLPRNSFVLAAPRRVDDDRWALVYRSFERDESAIAVIDVAEGSIDTIELDEPAYLLDVSEDSAIVVSADALARADTAGAFSIVPLAGGRARTLDADLDDGEVPRAAGFSPDGSFVVLAVDARNAEPDDTRLVSVPLDEEGRAGDPSVLLAVEEFSDDAPDDVNLFGVDAFGSIIWTEDGRLVFGTSNERLVVIETTPG